MKVLKKCDQIYIAKRLAAIYFIATHWNVEDIEFMEKTLCNIADIAFRVGGIEMMERGIPDLVSQLEKKYSKLHDISNACDISSCSSQLVEAAIRVDRINENKM